jgi:hypothetical protein
VVNLFTFMQLSVEDSRLAKRSAHCGPTAFNDPALRPAHAPQAPKVPSFVEKSAPPPPPSTVVTRYRAHQSLNDADPDEVGGASGGSGNSATTDHRALALAFRRQFFGDAASTWKTLGGRQTPGVCGLDNLGNTWYVAIIDVVRHCSSAIMCFSCLQLHE